MDSNREFVVGKAVLAAMQEALAKQREEEERLLRFQFYYLLTSSIGDPDPEPDPWVKRSATKILLLGFVYPLLHGPNNHKDTITEMSSLLVFNRVYRLEIQSVMLVFSTPLFNQRSTNLSH